MMMLQLIIQQTLLENTKKKYPSIIKPIYQSENQYSKGVIVSNYNFIRIQGKYVSICEGDDYFTDFNKLQKQFDFLEAHSECSICFHPVNVVFECGEEAPSIFPSPEHRFNKTILTLDDLLERNFIQTNSVMYRWRFTNEDVLNYFPKNILPGDYYLHLLHAQKGDIGFMDDVMAVYRRHSGGIWWDSYNNLYDLHLKHGLKEIAFFDNVCKNIAPNQDDYFNNVFIKNFMCIAGAYIKYKRREELIFICHLIYKDYPEDLIKYCIETEKQRFEAEKDKNELLKQKNEIEQQLNAVTHSVSYRIGKKIMGNKLFHFCYMRAKKYITFCMDVTGCRLLKSS
ncbi:MAG: hypothetical protein Ta2G_12510 [Termitinemataceae bacterium]|nr:MAG: hypothetical protein Ta2G_12510 [Termitinemataceae bacterium]